MYVCVCVGGGGGVLGVVSCVEQDRTYIEIQLTTYYMWQFCGETDVTPSHISIASLHSELPSECIISELLLRVGLTRDA